MKKVGQNQQFPSKARKAPANKDIDKPEVKQRVLKSEAALVSERSQKVKIIPENNIARMELRILTSQKTKQSEERIIAKSDNSQPPSNSNMKSNPRGRSRNTRIISKPSPLW